MLQFYCFSISNLRYEFKKHGFLSLPKTLKIQKRSEVYVDEAFKEVFKEKTTQRPLVPHIYICTYSNTLIISPK